MFFICLGYLLLGGYNYIYIGAHHRDVPSAIAQHIENSHQQKFTNKNQGYAVIKKSGTEKQEECLFIDEEEEEDPDNSFVRKYILLARGYLALSGQSVLIDCYCCPGVPPTYCSPKYITQGALRI